MRVIENYAALYKTVYYNLTPSLPEVLHFFQKKVKTFRWGQRPKRAFCL